MVVKCRELYRRDTLYFVHQLKTSVVIATIVLQLLNCTELPVACKADFLFSCQEKYVKPYHVQFFSLLFAALAIKMSNIPEGTRK